MNSKGEQSQLSSILSRLTTDEYEILKNHFSSKSTNQGMNRSTFTQEEDRKLKELVKEYGENSWSLIATQMPNRTTRQCRERYRHYLSPSIINGKWTPEDDKLLMSKYNELGPRWVSIAKFFQSRTDINVKNRWIVLMRKNATMHFSVQSSPTDKPKIISVKRGKSRNDEKRGPAIKPKAKAEKVSKEGDEIHQLFEEYDTLSDWDLDNSIESF